MSQWCLMRWKRAAAQSRARPPSAESCRRRGSASPCARRDDEILDAVRGGEEATERRRQVELERRQRLLQPFTKTGGGRDARCSRANSSGSAPGGGPPPLLAARYVGAALPARTAGAVGDHGEEIALPVQLASLDHRPNPGTFSSALRNPLPPSITHNTVCRGAAAGSSSRAGAPCRSWRFLSSRAGSPGVLLPSAPTPRATISVWPATWTPSRNRANEVERVQAAAQLRRELRARGVTSRLTALLLVARLFLPGAVRPLSSPHSPTSRRRGGAAP